MNVCAFGVQKMKYLLVAAAIAVCPPPAAPLGPSPCCDVRWGVSRDDVLDRFGSGIATRISVTYPVLGMPIPISGRQPKALSFSFSRDDGLQSIDIFESAPYDVVMAELIEKYGEPYGQIACPFSHICAFTTTWVSVDTDTVIYLRTDAPTIAEGRDVSLQYRRMSVHGNPYPDGRPAPELGAP